MALAVLEGTGDLGRVLKVKSDQSGTETTARMKQKTLLMVALGIALL